jgi:hypothetical protein
MDPLENWLLLKSDVQNFQRSWDLKNELFPPAHAKLSAAFPQICISQRFNGESPHYLADQMLWGCQSANNQFQALQNQEIEDFSVQGSRLSELEAEVVQIQPLRISLRYLIFVDQQDLVLGGFMFLSFGPLADFSLFFYCFGF